jgi:metal-sulfur cluster biosynthetic enzyme
MDQTLRSAGSRGEPSADAVREALRLVVDPEVGVNVVDLGLVYDVTVCDDDVQVTMTMTTPACPLGESLTEQAEATVRQNVAGVRSVRVDLVWEPPWEPSMMSGEARKQLGWR